MFSILLRFTSMAMSGSTATLLLAFIGFTAYLHYGSWWLQSSRLSSPWLFIGFITMLLYTSAQTIGSWVLYIAAHYAKN